MPKRVEGRHTVTIRLADVEYENLKNVAAKTHQSMGAIARDYTIKGLSGEITQDNIEFLLPIIREQIRNIMEPLMERQIALTAKTCVQASTAAYLCADSILKFVPKEQRDEVRDSYEKARKKAVEYVKSKPVEQ